MDFFNKDYEVIAESVADKESVFCCHDNDIAGRSNTIKNPIIKNHYGNAKGMVFFGIFIVLAFYGLSTALTVRSTSLDTTAALTSSMLNIPVLGKKAKPPRKCKFNECYASSCDFDTEYYTCITQDGAPHGGCSTHPWYKSTCDDQCDLSKCSVLHAPKSVDSCKYVQCDPDWCQGNQLCPKEVPYQCMEGTAIYGCSTSGYQWTAKTPDDTCSKCCDATTCPEPIIDEPYTEPDTEPAVGTEENPEVEGDGDYLN